MSKPTIAILGAGPAGLGAAYRLNRTGKASATVFEQGERVGGNAGSFELAGFRVDYGSHRLHPACDPELLEDIRALLGEDLLDRPRHGRICLRGRWIHFPLKPLDLALGLPPDFILGVAGDTASKIFRRSRRKGSENEATFASIMEQSLGRTICRDFYFPYARKLWGLEPEVLSPEQARRRVSNNSLGKMVRKVLAAAPGAGAVPGLKPKGSGRFFYPRCGYGQISEAYAAAAESAGAEILLGARVHSVSRQASNRFIVTYAQGGEPHSKEVDSVWSTIPITLLARMVDPAPPAELLKAAGSIETRAMILIYLVLEQERFSEWDAHYFPDTEILISRLSEPKNYNSGQGPQGLTVLCAELPCTADGPEWRMSDDDLGWIVCDSLARAGIPVQAPVRQVFIRRLRHAYPIYRQGWEQPFEQLDAWLGGIHGLLTFGRQGLFAHDNTHHALFMAYKAVECLDDSGHFNGDRWAGWRQVFQTHVVED